VTCSIACQAAKVAAYLSGHDHNLQHIVKLSDPKDDTSTPLWPQYVVSGAGSETRQDEKEKYSAKVGPVSSPGGNGSARVDIGAPVRQRHRVICLLGMPLLGIPLGVHSAKGLPFFSIAGSCLSIQSVTTLCVSSVPAGGLQPGVHD